MPNQLPLFLLVKLGAWLCIVAGEPGLSDLTLSDDDDNVRIPQNFRTDDGRRGGDARLLAGLMGDAILLAASFVRVRCNSSSGTESSDSAPCDESLCCEKKADLGVGCDESGPAPGVGGCGESGGESGGAGIEVPSVREKLMGVSVSGL